MSISTGIRRRVVIDVTNTADQTIAVVTGKLLRCVELMISATADFVVTFKNGSTSVGVLNLLAAGTNAIVLPMNDDGHFQTAKDAALVISGAGTGSLDGYMIYDEVG